MRKAVIATFVLGGAVCFLWWSYCYLNVLSVYGECRPAGGLRGWHSVSAGNSPIPFAFSYQYGYLIWPELRLRSVKCPYEFRTFRKLPWESAWTLVDIKQELQR